MGDPRTHGIGARPHGLDRLAPAGVLARLEVRARILHRHPLDLGGGVHLVVQQHLVRRVEADQQASVVFQRPEPQLHAEQIDSGPEGLIDLVDAQLRGRLGPHHGRRFRRAVHGQRQPGRLVSLRLRRHLRLLEQGEIAGQRRVQLAVHHVGHAVPEQIARLRFRHGASAQLPYAARSARRVSSSSSPAGASRPR